MTSLFSYLNAVERGGSIVASNAIEDALNVTQFVCWPSAVHVGHGFPGVTAGTEPLSGLETHGAVIAPHTIEILPHGGHPTRGPPAAHGWHGLPPAHPHIQPLHLKIWQFLLAHHPFLFIAYAGLVVVGVEASQGVDAMIQNSYPTISPPCHHGRTRGPHPTQRIISLHSGQTWLAIISTTAINETV